MLRRSVLLAAAIAAVAAALLVPQVIASREARTGALTFSAVQHPVAGVEPLYLRAQFGDHHGQAVIGYAVRPGESNTVLPPGVSRLPGPGEAVVSPGLEALLLSHDGDALRPLFPMGVVSLIAEDGLAEDGELRYYVGDRTVGRDNAVYEFGAPTSPAPSWPFEVVAALASVLGIASLIRTLPMWSWRMFGAQAQR
ncbi:hypothetical protein KALB_8402 [Kutzneria albida DSM 43870]|uniref:Uncharacterized protein n=1 Tax=Kutzneria albida DSM 43870 TaxID=1449976 RepID=W5WKM8_9PSEU|nr:hypothetical protein KALB_8402 [Kutzneria albida DSM 43870]